MKPETLERFLEDYSQEGISKKVFYDRKGSFIRNPRSFSEIVEARVSNGRGYYSDKDFPRKFSNWKDELKEGYPDYHKLYLN